MLQALLFKHTEHLFLAKKGYVSDLRHVFFHIACLLLCVLTHSHHYNKLACTIILFWLYSRNAIAGTLSSSLKYSSARTPTTTKLLPSRLMIAYLLPSRRMLALQYNAPMNQPRHFQRPLFRRTLQKDLLGNLGLSATSLSMIS